MTVDPEHQILANKKWKWGKRMKGSQDGSEVVWRVIRTGLGLVWCFWATKWSEDLACLFGKLKRCR